MKETAFALHIAAAVHESSLSVSKLAQMSGLGRTAIQHVISGDFLPTKQFLDDLCSVLQLTPDRRTQIYESYLSEKLGRQHYLSCRKIIGMMEDLPVKYNSQTVKGLEILKLSPLSSTHASGKVDTITLCMNVVFDEMTRESPHLMLTVPVSHRQFFTTFLQTINYVDKQVKIEHFGRLLSEEGSETNFEKIHIGLKLAMCHGANYQAYYYYSVNGDREDFFPPYPYCIKSSRYVVFMNESLTMSILTDSEMVNDQMDAYFDMLIRRSKPFFTRIKPDEIIDYCAYSSGSFISSVGYMPTFSPFFTKEMFDTRLRPEYRRSDNNPLSPVKSDMKTRRKRESRQYFSAAGLREFAETGRMIGVPGEYFDPLDPKDRRIILTRLRECAFDIIDPAVFGVGAVQVVMYTERKVLICVSTPEDIYCYRIDEIFIVNELGRFIDSLVKMGMIVSDKEKYRMIDMYISQLDEIIQHDT